MMDWWSYLGYMAGGSLAVVLIAGIGGYAAATLSIRKAKQWATKVN